MLDQIQRILIGTDFCEGADQAHVGPPDAAASTPAAAD